MQSLGTCSSMSSASSRFFRLCAKVLRPTPRRHQSSYRRSRSKLNIKPDASFLPSTTETHDHIIFNPPPSAPNVYHTPTIFLPKDDRRRQLHEALAQGDTTLSMSSSAILVPQRLPPPVRKPYEKRYHLTEAEMQEMRRLRREDPVKWSATQLGKKFDCSSLFVGFVTEGLSKEKQEQQKLVTQVVKSRWGPKRRVAREDRALRKERWYKDE